MQPFGPLCLLTNHNLLRIPSSFHMVSKVDNRRSGEPTLSMAAVDWTKTTSTKWEVAFSSNTLSFSYLFTTHNCTGLLQGFYVSSPCFPNQHVVRLTRRVVGQFIFLAVNAQYQATPNACVSSSLCLWMFPSLPSGQPAEEGAGEGGGEWRQSCAFIVLPL